MSNWKLILLALASAGFAAACASEPSSRTSGQSTPATRGEAAHTKTEPTTQTDPAGQPEPTTQTDPAGQPEPTIQTDPDVSTSQALVDAMTSVAESIVTTVGGTVTTISGGDASISGEDSSIPAGMDAMVAAARSDLADLVGVSQEDIRLADASFVVWPDSGYGCPEKGVSHTQVPVDGAYVVLVANGVEYHYHKGGVDPVFYCATPVIPSS